jgi:hypothetical protein
MVNEQEQMLAARQTSDNDGVDALVPARNAKRAIEIGAARLTSDDHGDDVLVPSRGTKVVEIETEAHKERRRRLRSSRELQQSTSQASPPRGSGEYAISFRFLSSITAQQQASFTYAAARLGKMLTTNLQSVTTTPALRCQLAPNEILPTVLDEMFIFVKIVNIDGVGTVLGQASPCLEDRDGFPRVGYIEFDTADVSQMITENTFDAVVTHEMMHILGIGTLWEDKKFVRGTTDPRYHGQFGAEALAQINGAYMGTPAVQDVGGDGTALSHWRDAVFGDEMMTAFLSASFQPVSRMTVEAFRDLGYTVDATTADSFTTPQLNLANVPRDSNSQGGASPSTLSTGAIAGIAVGGAFVLAVVVMLLMRGMKRTSGGGSGPSAFSSSRKG